MPGIGQNWGNILSGQSKPQGLTAADRTEEDKRAIAQQGGNTPSYSAANIFNRRIAIPSTAEYFSALGQHLDDVSAAYAKSVDDLQRQFAQHPTTVYANLEDIASKASPYYRQYKNSFANLSNFTKKELLDLYSNYQTSLNKFGEAAANKQLNDAMRDKVSQKQPLIDKAFAGTNTFLTSMVGSLVGTAGILKGIYDLRAGNIENNPNLSDWENIVNAMVDNSWTRYGNDIVETGTFDPKNIQKQKEIGIPAMEVVQTTGQINGTDSLWDQIMNENTPFVAFGQAGFTTGMALTALATDGIASSVFKGMKGAAYAARGSQVIKSLEAAKNVISGIQKQERLFNAFVIPAISGTGEGVIEGLQTKKQVYENGMRALEERQEKAVSDEIDRLVQTGQLIPETTTSTEGTRITRYYDRAGYEVDMNALVSSLSEKYKPYMDAAAEHLEATAARAGIGNFLANSAINGVINATFKAGLQAPRVKNALANTKVFGWAQNKLGYAIDEVGDKYKVTPRFGKIKSVYNIVKEPFGEFTEEYLQTLSDATMQGWADHNFHSFIEKKYNGEADVAVGDSFAGDWSAAWSRLSESAFSQEAMKAGIYGAIGSIMGSPMLKSRGQIGRRYNSDGTEKNAFQKAMSWSPIYWRSGAVQAWKEDREDKKASKVQAQALEDWLNNPKNKEKFDGAAGTYAWAASMQAAGKINDEFSYRNSKLGKTINDIFMLQQAKGTSLYDSIMNTLAEAANLEEGTEAASKYIASIKENSQLANLHEGKSDKEILATVKENANDMLTMMDRVAEEEENIRQLYTDSRGSVDTDLKQSLIYSKLAREDYDKRIAQLQQKLGSTAVQVAERADAKAGIETQQLSKEEKQILSEYGSFEKAWQTLTTLREQRAALGKDVRRLEARKKNLTKKERAILKYKKVQRAQLAERIKRLSKAQENISKSTNTDDEGNTVTTVGNPVMSAADIMALDPIERARMLLQAHKKRYEMDKQGLVVGEDAQASTPVTEHNYYSAEQQAVLDALLEEGRAVNDKFLTDIVDLGRLEQSRDNLLKQEIAVLSDKDSFNRYVQMAKRGAARANVIKQGEKIAEIQDYTEFAQALEEAGGKLSKEDIGLLLKTVKDSGNENYAKYSKNRQTLAEAFDFLAKDPQVDKDFNGNQLDLFATAAVWLTNKGIDLDNFDAIYAALSEINETTGKTEFEEYVNKTNEDKRDNSEPETVFTSTEEVYNDLLDLLGRTTEHLQRLEAQNAPIVIQPAASDNPPSRPASARQPEPQPQPLPEDNRQEEQPEPPSGNVIIEKFKRISGDRIAEAISECIAEIINTDNSRLGENAEGIKTQLLTTLNTLADTRFDDEDALMRTLGNMESRLSGDPGAIYVFSAAVERVRGTSAQRARKYATLNKNRFEGNPNAAVMSTINMADTIARYPDSPITKFIKRHKILEFIREKLETIINESAEPVTIYFFSDAQLTQEVKDGMRESYDHSQQPIFIAIQHEEGQILGEDGTTRYQPIGIMPANDNETIRGSSHMKGIRERATEDGIVKGDDGNPLTTTFSSIKNFIIAAHPDISTSSTPNNELSVLLEGEFAEEEKQELTVKQEEKPELSRDAALKETNAWKKAKERFLEHFVTFFFPSRANTEDSQKGFAYVQSNLKGGEAGPIRVFIHRVSETIGNNGQILLELINARKQGATTTFGNAAADQIVKFNSRTKRIKKIVEDGILVPIFNRIEHNVALDSDAATFLAKMSKELDKIRNILYFNKDYSFKVVDTAGENEAPRYTIRIVDEDGVKVKDVATFTADHSPNDTDLTTLTADIISGLILDESGNLDESGERDFVRWQLAANNVDALHEGDERAKQLSRDNISEMIDDGLFYGAASTLSYVVGGVEIDNPLVGTTSNEPDTDDSNAAAAGTRPAGVGEGQGGRPVDTNSGLSMDGSGPANPPTRGVVGNVQSVVERIKANSSAFELLPDESGYRNKKTGKVYARVTSIKSADETKGKPWQEGNMWEVPSTAVGNIIDSIVRDFFSGTLRSTSANTKFGRQYIAKSLSDSLGLELPDVVQDLYYNTTDNTITMEVNIEEGVNITFSYTADGNLSDIKANPNISSTANRETVERLNNFAAADYAQLLSNLLNSGSVLRTSLAGKSEEELSKLGIASINDINNPNVSESAQRNLDEALRNQGAKLKNLYPNITDAAYDRVISALTRQRTAWEAEGWTVTANDIKAVGTIDVYGDAGIESLDVCGTLDILLTKEDGTAKVVDIKTIHKPLDLSSTEASTRYTEAIEERKPGWELQTSLYQKFLSDSYPELNFAGREILPFEVEYTDPTSTSDYAKRDDGTLMRKGIEESVNVIPHTLETLEYVEPHIIEEKLAQKDKDILEQQQAEKATMQRIKDTFDGIAASIEDAKRITIGDNQAAFNQFTGVEDRARNRFEDDDNLESEYGEVADANKPDYVIPTQYTWDNLPSDVRAKLEVGGFTRESWNNPMDISELENRKKCILGE